MEHIKMFFKGDTESYLDPVYVRKFEQTIDEMEELTPMQKLLLEHKGRVVHYTPEGKIDVLKVLQKFQGTRKYTIYDYNPKNFNFDEVAEELHTDLNKLWLRRQNSLDMGYIFEN